MSVSDADRRQDRHRTLVLMHESVGDEHLFGAFIVPTDPKFAGVLPTTWRELIDDGLVNTNGSTLGRSPRS